MTSDEMVITLVVKQVELFENKNVEYLHALCGGAGMRTILLNGYRMLVRQKEVPAIETIEQGKKQLLWDESIEATNGAMSVEETMDYARCLHTLKTILNK